MGYRYNVSYPFYDIAQRYDLDYGLVLAAATWLESGSMGECPVEEDTFPLDAMQEVANLTDMPVHLRGGRTDICDVCGAERRGGTFAIDCKMPVLSEELEKVPVGAKCLKFMPVH
jgi:hypothetical protein